MVIQLQVSPLLDKTSETTTITWVYEPIARFAGVGQKINSPQAHKGPYSLRLKSWLF